jgi:GDP-mannose 6-dehydrogenase
MEKSSGKKKNRDFAVVSNPEFLREGNAVDDYHHPPYTVLGSESRKGLQVGRELYQDLPAPVFETEVKEAEILKYVNNSFHALKITFANEVGNICKHLGIDSHRVMDIFARDTKLNISPAYLKPGFAYGGSCLPKDLKALNTFAHDFYLSTPVLNAIHQSNRQQIEMALNMVYSSNSSKLGILGLSFKPGTDDLRLSPVVEVVEQLLGKGYELAIYDSNVELSRLTGGNKSFIEQKLPHLGKLLEKDLDKVVNQSETLIVANREKEFEELKIPESVKVIDLARIDALNSPTNYQGIAW